MCLEAFMLCAYSCSYFQVHGQQNLQTSELMLKHFTQIRIFT